MFSTSITIFNKQYNPEQGRDVWKRTVIHSASWYGKQAVTVGDKGLNAASLYTVRIPIHAMPSDYLSPDKYNAFKGFANGWTVQTGDIIVREVVKNDIATPKEVTGKYSECFTVLSIRDNRRGLFAQHLKIEGK